MYPLCKAFTCVVALLSTTAAYGGESELYGLRGELWEPEGRLPDFSHAGYMGEGGEPPEVPVVVDVSDFGAVGDGIADDTAAFQQAIAEATEGAVFIQPGSYRLTDVLYIEKSGVVLRGAGSDETTLKFERSLEELQGERPQWSWNGGLIWIRQTEAPVVVAEVLESMPRGTVEISVNDTLGFAAGDLVVLSVTDDSGALGLEFHNQQSTGGDCTWQQPMRFDWPVEIAEVKDGQLTLAQPTRLNLDATWSPRIRTIPYLRGVGVENLTIAFPEDESYAGHLQEPGFNAIFMEGGVQDSWVRNVHISNADNGVLTDQFSKRLTVRGLTLSGRWGHHGLNVAYTADSLFSEIHFENDWIHEFTFDHRSNGNVVERISADIQSVSLDHHRDGSHENLFTESDAKVNWVSGGSLCAGPRAGARQTFWNMAPEFLAPPWGNIQVNLVGDLAVEDARSEDQAWYENVDGLQPVNLYREQLAQRLGLPSTVVEPEPSEPAGCGCISAPRRGSAWGFFLLVLWLVRRKTIV